MPREGIDIAVAAPTIAEVWRNGSRQVRLARLLNVCRIIDCDRQLARSGGEIMAQTHSRETLDAIVVAAARHGRRRRPHGRPVRSQITRRRCRSPASYSCATSRPEGSHADPDRGRTALLGRISNPVVAATIDRLANSPVGLRRIDAKHGE